jgi:hypothetical protein
MQEITNEQEIDKAKQREDRIARYVMFAPTAVGVLLVVILLLLLVPRSPAEVSIVGDIMMICFVICPILLCLLPLYIILAVGIFYINKLNNYTGSKLGAVTRATQRFKDTTKRVTEDLGRRTIGWRSRFAIMEDIIKEDENELED